MNRQGPAHLKMGSFAPAAAPAGRGGLNSRLGGTPSGWSGVHPPPGVPTPTTRPGSTMHFSGTLNNSHAHLDMNDFPALGGQPSTAHPQTWNRLNTQSPSQNRGPPGHPPPTQQQQQQDFTSVDDFNRIGGNAGMGGGNTGQQPAQRQGQLPPSSTEDFPALPPRVQQPMGQLEDRGLGMGALAGQRGNIGGSRLMPQESMMGGPLGMLSDAEKKSMMKGAPQSLANGAPGLSNPPTGLSQSLGPSHPSPAPGLGMPPQLQHAQPKYSNGMEFGGGQASDGPQNPMADPQQFKFDGLLNIIRGANDNRDDPVLVGTDLTNLGLDLNQPDLPLWPTFASPFAELETKNVEPDFTLPACYQVHNTQPVNAKMASFSDETLFYIFYTMPRDIMQELVVQELATRNWRYHMVHQLWVTKDDAVRVSPLSDQAERGVYIFFDPTQWERVRKEITLEYAHLDPRTTGSYTGNLHGHIPLGGLL